MWMNDNFTRWYEVLNLTHEVKDGQKTIPLNVVLFRARTGAAPSAYLRPLHGPMLLCKAINAIRIVYTSPTNVPRSGSSKDCDQQLGNRDSAKWRGGRRWGLSEDRTWDTQELKGVTDYEIICKTLTTALVDPPGFARVSKIVRVEGP